jgi:hypothetical protein
VAITAIPIQPVKTISGNQWASRRIIEEATQTFKIGTVLALAADGGVIAWAGATLSGLVGSPIGISYEAASNLASTGLGAPAPNQPVTGLGAALTFGSVQNESAAKNIPHGAPLNDGRVGLVIAQNDTVFSATFGNAGAPQTPAATDVGVQYGLTIDTGSNFWYVDKAKVTVGTNTAVRVVGLDLRDAAAAGTRVLFQFVPGVVEQLG